MKINGIVGNGYQRFVLSVLTPYDCDNTLVSTLCVVLDATLDRTYPDLFTGVVLAFELYPLVCVECDIFSYFKHI